MEVVDLMPIGEFAERSGLSPRRLRSYAAAGVLVPAAVDPSSGYRYYAPGQLQDARLIDALRTAGVPVPEIRSFLDDDDPLDRLDRWAHQVDVDATQRHDALELARRLLTLGGDVRGRPGNQARRAAVTTLHAAARTDIGRVRQNNEDAVLCRDDLVAIADGMGGHPGGEVAANLALALLDTAFSGQTLDELASAARAASRAICERAAASEDLEGMGTTLCTVGVTADDRLAVVNVGDSRAYLLRDGAWAQLTVDHSWTAELVRQGQLTAREAVDHPHRGVLTRVLGMGPTVDVDGALHAALPGDRLLLCTDGLFNEVDEHDLAATMQHAGPVEALVDALVEQALSNGGRDNVGVIVADVRA